MVDPAYTVLTLDPDVSKRIRHFPDVNAATEYAEDALIRRHGGAAPWAAIDPGDHPLVAGLEPRIAELLGAMLVPRTYADGEALALAGQPPTGLSLLLSGMLDVSVRVAGARRHLSMFTVGTTFGVIYAVAARNFDVDAHAVGEVRVVQLPMSALADLKRTAPEVLVVIMQRLVAGAFDNLDWVTRALVMTD
jgi:CRP-like cAMP-binding protein